MTLYTFAGQPLVISLKYTVVAVAVTFPQLGCSNIVARSPLVLHRLLSVLQTLCNCWRSLGPV